MSWAVKLHLPGGKAVVVKNLDPEITFGALKAKIAEHAEMEASEIKVMGGFPPREYEGAMDEMASSLGIEKGSVLTITKTTAARAEPPPPPAPSGTSSQAPSVPSSVAAPPQPQHPPTGGSQEASDGVKSLKEMGFPEAMARRALQICDGDVNAAFELCLSGSIPADEGPASHPSSSQYNHTSPTRGSSSSSSSSSSSTTTSSNSTGMVRRVIDADNSCLFNAVGYLMEKSKKVGAKLRGVIADAVRKHPDTYSEAVLGKERDEYCRYILDPSKWGGEIELFILSQHYKVEIVAVEIRSLHCYCYGEGHGFPRRCYVLYDGVHYDALVREPYPGAGEEYDVTKFDINDEDTRKAALALAGDLKQRRHFVDLVGCSLRCMVCEKAFKGQEEALAHARVTLHQNFGEV